MPNQEAPPLLREANLGSEPLKTAAQSIDDSYALAVVNQTFAHYEMWRRNNHDTRWQLNDMLYFGQVEKKVWEGTNVPRASLSQPIVFDQIEAALPAIKQALFPGGEWFDVRAEKGSTGKEAREVQEHLTYLLDHVTDDYGQTAVNEIEYALKDILKYGNGGVMLEYDPTKEVPVVQWVDIRDIFLDPGTPTPSVDAAKSIIHRRMMTIEEVKALKGHEDMNIPDDAVLYHMAQSRPAASTDLTKQVSEMMRRVQFSPGYHDDLPLPADKYIEVLVYTSASRIIWVLNREWVAYNAKNPYGFINYCFAPCYNVTGRFYGMSIPDVIGDTQLYIQALQNLRLDELSLAIQPPRVRKRGAAVTQSQLKWKPGMVAELENPKEDMILHFPNGASANVAQEIAALEIQAEKRTGVNALGMGVPRPGNANRTLGGMQLQMQGSSNRLSTIVSHVEDFLIVPMLYKLYRMTRTHGKVDKQLTGFREGEFTNVDMMSFFQPVRFKMNAASKMMTKENLQQVFPYLAQFLFQGPMIQQLSQLGYGIDFMEMFTMLQDATGIDTKYDIIRPLNEQEKQALSQPPPEVQAMMQKAQAEGEIRLQMGQMKNESETMKHQLEFQARAQETEEKSARELLKLMYGSQQEQAKAEGEKKKLEVQLQGMIQKMNLEQQKALMEMLMGQKQHQQSLQQQREQSLMDLQTNQMNTQAELQKARMLQQQGMAHSDMQMSQKLAQNEAMGQQKMEQMKAMNVLAGPRGRKPTPKADKSDKKKR